MLLYAERVERRGCFGMGSALLGEIGTWKLLPLSRQERESLVMSYILMSERVWMPEPACFPTVGQIDRGQEQNCSADIKISPELYHPF